MRIPAIIIFFIITLPLTGQKAMTLSQYMHNRFAINSAFAGSREVLSVFGSFRKQWAGLPQSPQAQYFTGHMPLRRPEMAVGLQIFNETFAIKRNMGVSLSYTYRLHVNPSTWMAFSLSGGFTSYSINWNEVTLENIEDEVFSTREASSGPQAGFGWSIYNHRFFGGISVPEFFTHDFEKLDGPQLDPGRMDYLFTGGYLLDLSSVLSFQPSFLLKINQTTGNWTDLSGSFIYKNMIWGGATYRTLDELVFHLGWQILPQLRMAYSYQHSLNGIGNFNNGGYEISLQYDFGYTVNTPNPKFF
ncbi:PorP/SprF family type IX secretion system membrane protein [Thermophagus sp. OGC60D27]|uniref:PorP/SprF family type IX secretion system membrane protein n=1 Tax=Thermophagus sp. OGC60D27 TaxID=3458415 RepID=UPI004037FC0C